jgi:hypothetical protein
MPGRTKQTCSRRMFWPVPLNRVVINSEWTIGHSFFFLCDFSHWMCNACTKCFALCRRVLILCLKHEFAISSIILCCRWVFFVSFLGMSCVSWRSIEPGWRASAHGEGISMAEPPCLRVDQSASLSLVDGHEHGPIHARVHRQGCGWPSAHAPGQWQVEGTRASQATRPQFRTHM